MTDFDKEASAALRSTSDPAACIYAIGDIHGRLDLLDRAIEAIRRDFGGSGRTAITVTIGDYIDRGPQSCGVLDRLAANPFPTPYVALKGNHEAIFERFMTDPSVGDNWRWVGGLETVASFGIAVADMMMGRNYDRAAGALKLALSPRQSAFLRSLRPSLSLGRYFLCHAGVRPGIPLEQQAEQDLLWIRDEFLQSTADFGKIVVHGHTPGREPQVRPNRINIDTGAFATGRLTCVVLEADGHRFLEL